jgi:SAM-dependent methyltransferase
MVPSAPSEERIVPLLDRHLSEALAAVAAVQHGRAAGPVTVLDVGCGNQPFAERLRQLGYVYHALDRAPSGAARLDYQVAIDASAEEFRTVVPGRFDLVLCTEVLEHVLDWDAAFRNLAAATAEDGYLLVSAPHFYFLHEQPHDYWRPTPHAVAAFAVRHGMQLRHVLRAGDAVDVLLTLGASLWFEPVVTGSRLRRRVSRILSGVANRLHGHARRALASGTGRWLRADSPYFLSTLALLARAGAPPTQGFWHE